MNAHLNQEQLYNLLDSPMPDAQAQVHLASCGSCREELGRVSSSLYGLRSALTGFAAAHPVPAFERPVVSAFSVRRGVRAFSRHGLAATIASAIVLLGVSLSTLHPRHSRPAASFSNALNQPSISDDELLDGIDRDLSASVPRSLAPLSVSTGGTSSNRSKASH